MKTWLEVNQQEGSLYKTDNNRWNYRAMVEYETVHFLLPSAPMKGFRVSLWRWVFEILPSYQVKDDLDG